MNCVNFLMCNLLMSLCLSMFITSVNQHPLWNLCLHDLCSIPQFVAHLNFEMQLPYFFFNVSWGFIVNNTGRKLFHELLSILCLFCLLRKGKTIQANILLLNEFSSFSSELIFERELYTSVLFVSVQTYPEFQYSLCSFYSAHKFAFITFIFQPEIEPYRVTILNSSGIELKRLKYPIKQDLHKKEIL